MGNMGIDIDVNTRRVTGAKKEVTGLNKAIEETGREVSIPVNTEPVKKARKDLLNVKDAISDIEKHSDLSLDMSGTKEMQESLVAMQETLRQMQGLSGQGSRQGGKLDLSQRKEETRLNEKRQRDSEIYEKALSRIGTSLDALYAKKRKLESVPLSKPEEWSRAQQELQAVDAELAAKTAGYEKLQGKYDPKYDKLRERSGKVSQELRSYGDMPDPSDLNRLPSPGNALTSGMKTMSKLLGYGAALFGSFSLMQFFSQSLSNAASYSSGIAGLKMRGGSDLRNVAADLGYTPLETIAMQEEIGPHTGYTGRHLNRATQIAAGWGNLTGLGGDAIANYIGGTYAATGAKPEAYDKQLKYLRDTAVALGARGRIEEVLRSNQQIMSSMVSGRGGRELTAGERLGTLAMQMGLWSTSGQIGKGGSGANIFSSIDQSIRGGGKSPGEQILLAQALGVNNVRSLEDLWAYEKRKEEGASPRNVKAVIDFAGKIGHHMGLSGADQRQFTMRNIRDVFGLNNSQTEAVYNKAFLDTLDQSPEQAMKALQQTKEGRKLLKEANIDPMSLPEYQHRRTIAQYTDKQIDVGNKMMPWVDKLKNSATRVINDVENGNYPRALIDALKDNPLGQLMLLGTGLGIGSKLMPNVAIPVPMPGKSIPKTVGKVAPMMLGPVGVGVVTGLGVMAPKEVGAGENEIVRLNNRGASQEEIEQAKNRQKQESENGGLIAALWELIHSLNVWMRAQQGHTIQQQLPDQPQRFITQ